jgi:hypothetical protein
MKMLIFKTQFRENLRSAQIKYVNAFRIIEAPNNEVSLHLDVNVNEQPEQHIKF